MFHYVRGVPYDFNGGAYDNLNMWEQIDDGAQYTPAKKFLLSVPIVLFLLSTHYTHYDFMYFTINFLATLGVVIPKLPFVSHAILLPSCLGLDADQDAPAEPSDACRTIFRGSRGLTRRRVSRWTGKCIWVIANWRWGIDFEAKPGVMWETESERHHGVAKGTAMWLANPFGSLRVQQVQHEAFDTCGV
jgi:hypothetical protein